MEVLFASNIRKWFGGVSVLQGIDLSVKKGERISIIGPNGAGKTTLFQCISGLLAPNAGAILLAGRNITKMPVHKRAQHGLARTFQVTNLFMELTVMENILLALQAFDAARFDLLRPRHRLGHLVMQAENHLAEWDLMSKANIAVKDLSYGEQRQMEIVLALAGSPIILLLDEPTAGLAAEDRKRLSTMIQSLSRSISLLLIEHDLDVAFSVAENVKVMHMGQIIMSGSPNDIMKNSQIQEIYLGVDYADAGN